MKRILFGFVGFVVVVSMGCSLPESAEEELPAPEVSVSEEEVSQDNQPPDTPEPPPQGEDAGSGDEVAEEPAAEEETTEEPAAEPVEETSASSSEPEPEGFNDGGLGFTKQVDVFGSELYATENVPDEKLLHAAAVMAEYLDNNEDGIPDNQAIVNVMIEEQAALVMFRDEREESDFDIESFFQSRYNRLVIWNAIFNADALQNLYAEETHPRGSTNEYFDATLEEVLHLITHIGYANAYPEIWGESPGTAVAQAMDIARGGHIEEIPSQYPVSAWYTYDDRSCEYDCQITEYVYWALTSILGAQQYEGRLDEIENEWKLNTPEKVSAQDVAIYALLTDPVYAFPTHIPDGKYAGINITITKLIEK